ncbi:Telomere-associated protein Rif1 N-terminal domain-containing protein [Pleurotus pulmonarius]
MSLPTPPSTSHREKEAAGSRVVWSQTHQYHCLTSPPRFAPSKSVSATPKSILKRRTYSTLPIDVSERREVTPEPSDPLADLTYLESTVSKIVALETPVRELIEAYSVLAARLRSCIPTAGPVDSSWPLFRPLRKNRAALTEAIVRDLGRALEEPPKSEEPVELCEERCLLPSPAKSPRKRGGLSAEQVKHARDVCQTCHAVMRLLALVFTTPALYNIFKDLQLDSMLTQVLAIPLADTLPTPNARKTYALAIWLLSAQRLPADILLPARDRIAYALRRGIDGELGKEGKKGSVSDGLKAIHDLSLHHPETFVPAFTELLPSVLGALLGPTLTLRVQACHALGGFAYAAASLERCQLHTRISTTVADFLTEEMSTAISASPIKSPSKSPSKDPALIRTLRTTLLATEPQHPAQGPTWALCVLANLIILIGPALYTSARLERSLRAMLAVGMRTKRSSVRAVLCLVWRCLAWVYFQPPLLPDPDSESEVEEEDDDAPQRPDVRGTFWDLASTYKDMGCGVNLIYALLSDPNTRDEERFERAFGMLKAMLKRGGTTREEAMLVLRRLCSSDAEAEADGFDMKRLLPPSLFSANPGLLSVDYKNLATVVKPMFADCLQVDDITPLTREEITRESILDELLEIWKEGFRCIEMPDRADPPEDIVATWEGVVKANGAFFQDSGDDDGTAEFAIRAVNVLTGLLEDDSLDVRVKQQVLSPGPPATSPVKRQRKLIEINERTNADLLITIVHSLWTHLQQAIPRELLGDAAKEMLSGMWTVEHRLASEARAEWASLCADVILTCEGSSVDVFWSRAWNWAEEDVRVSWEAFAERWRRDSKAGWEGAVALLNIPFESGKAWELRLPEVELWENLLTYAVNSALDYGHEAGHVLDQVAGAIMRSYDPTSSTIVRIADILLSQLNIAEARELPCTLLQFVNEALLSSYPPEPRNTVHIMWVVRTLTDVLESCPLEMVMELMDLVGEGLAVWVTDECSALPLDDYAYNIATMYEMVLATTRPLPATEDLVQRLSPFFESALQGRSDKPASVYDALRDIWDSKYSLASIPTATWPVSIQEFFGLAASSQERELVEASPAATAAIVEQEQEESPQMLEPAVVLEMPSTPLRSREVARPSTPTSEPIFHFAPLQSPRSPGAATPLLIPSTPIRTPLLKSKRRLSPGSALTMSPSKRRRLEAENKENESPVVIASVMDRILNQTPVSAKPMKRAIRDEDEDEEIHHRVLKKSKSFPPSSHYDDEEESLVEAQLLPSTDEDVFSSCSRTVRSQPKRKLVFDAVEVPSLRDAYGLGLSRSATPKSRMRPRVSSSTGRTTRRHLDFGYENKPTPASPFTPLRESFMTKLLGSPSPLPEMAVPDSDDSIMADDVPQKLSSDVPSSDDFLGVVTPHRLISPPPRRSAFKDDPPSDDSVVGSSPTRHVAARRLSRQNSNSLQRPALISMETF